MVHAPYRHASPPEPPRTDEADSYEQTLVAERSRERRTGALLALLGLTLVTIICTTASPRKTHAEAARERLAPRLAGARKTVDDATQRAMREQVRFELEVRAALDESLSPSTPLTPCGVTLAEPDRLVRGRATFPLLVVDRKDERALPSPSLARVWNDIQQAAELLAGGTPTAAMVYADALEMRPVASRLVRDVVLVRTKLQRPVRSSATSFEPGTVDGIAYVYDFAEHRITCAGEVHATNARALEYTWSDRHDAPTWQDQGLRLDATLEEDLDTQVARAIAAPGALSAVTASAR